MSSAPEHADKLLALAGGLPRDRLDQLVLKWIDRCVRVHAPSALDRAGRATEASALRALPELRDRGSCVGARAVVLGATDDLGSGGSEVEAMAGLFGLAVTLDDYLGEETQRLNGVIVGIVTSARCMGAWDEEREQIAELTALLTLS
jgi:hypothetical protein